MGWNRHLAATGEVFISDFGGEPKFQLAEQYVQPTLLAKVVGRSDGRRVHLMIYADHLELKIPGFFRAETSSMIRYEHVAQVAQQRSFFGAGLVIESSGGGKIAVAGLSRGESDVAYRIMNEQIAASRAARYQPQFVARRAAPVGRAGQPPPLPLPNRTPAGASFPRKHSLVRRILLYLVGGVAAFVLLFVAMVVTTIISAGKSSLPQTSTPTPRGTSIAARPEEPSATASTTTEPTPPAPRPASAEPAVVQAAGLGISREQFIKRLTVAGARFSFRQGVSVKRAENYVGSGKGSSMQLLGPGKDIMHASIFSHVGQKGHNQQALADILLFAGVFGAREKAWAATEMKKLSSKEAFKDVKTVGSRRLTFSFTPGQPSPTFVDKPTYSLVVTPADPRAEAVAEHAPDGFKLDWREVEIYREKPEWPRVIVKTNARNEAEFRSVAKYYQGKLDTAEGFDILFYSMDAPDPPPLAEIVSGDGSALVKALEGQVAAYGRNQRTGRTIFEKYP